MYCRLFLLWTQLVLIIKLLYFCYFYNELVIDQAGVCE